MTSEEFRRLGHELIDWLADYRANVAEFPVMAQTAPGDIRARLPDQPPKAGEDLSNLLGDLETLVLPGLTHWQSPRFFGYFPANAELSSVLGDLLSSGLGQLGLNWQSSPALTEFEEAMTDWLRQLLGLPDTFQGVIQDTASTSSLVALLCAREKASQYSLGRGGLQAEARPLTVYVSEQSHSSIEKAALLAGFGRDNVRSIATDDTFALDVGALEAAIDKDVRAGFKPCAIIATTGTTATTAMDPVGEMARVAREHDLWLHVDSAMAGSAMILPECRKLWAGVEGADSVVLNPHKWLGAVFDLSLFYVRDPETLVRVMSTNPSYLQTAADGVVRNYRDWGIPLGRRFRALKLWLLLRSEGTEGLRARLRRDLANAQWLAEQIDAAPGWERLAPVPLQTVCLRYRRPDLEGDELDAHTKEWVARINASGAAYLTPAKVAGSWLVRVSIGALLTERADVEALWQLMQLEAEKS